MRSDDRPFPEIARFPEERKLEGPPRRKSDSVFVMPGVADACDVLSQASDANSKERRIVVDNFVNKIVRDKVRVEELLTGLETVSSGEITDSNGLMRQASFLHDTFNDRFNKKTVDTTNPESDDDQNEGFVSLRAKVNLEWANGLMDSDLGKSERRTNLKKDPVLQRTVAKLVKQGDQSDPEVVSAGSALFNRFTDETDSEDDLIERFMAVAYAIDKSKVKAIGFNGSTKVSNLIIQSAGTNLAGKLPPTQASLDKIEMKIQEVKEEKPEKLGWYYPKFVAIGSNIHQRIAIREYAANYRKVEDLYQDQGDADKESMRELSEQAMDKLLALRKYGLKSAYFRDGVMHGKDQSWLFVDPEFQNLDGEPMFSDNILAVINLINKTRVKQIPSQLRTEKVGEGSLIQADSDLTAHLGLGMMPDGELMILPSAGILPARREFADAGAENTYELLRLSLITKVFDLVVPSEYSKVGKNNDVNVGIIGRMKNALKLNDPAKLLVPRLRMIVEKSDEIEEAIKQEIQSSRATVREHDVVWHIRVLPEGFTPSDSAREEAEKRGVTLGENETFVKSHTRGNASLGKVESHEAIKRTLISPF